MNYFWFFFEIKIRFLNSLEKSRSAEKVLFIIFDGLNAVIWISFPSNNGKVSQGFHREQPAFKNFPNLCGSIKKLQKALIWINVEPTLSGLYSWLSAKSTLVRTKMVRFPEGSIWLTRSVTLLRSASREPSATIQKHTQDGFIEIWNPVVLWNPPPPTTIMDRLDSYGRYHPNFHS